MFVPEMICCHFEIKHLATYSGQISLVNLFQMQEQKFLQLNLQFGLIKSCLWLAEVAGVVEHLPHHFKTQV
jgi:hypothetical protein